MTYRHGRATPWNKPRRPASPELHLRLLGEGWRVRARTAVCVAVADEALMDGLCDALNGDLRATGTPFTSLG
jgi:hypothetical protein